jgi:hypothetical protein
MANTFLASPVRRKQLVGRFGLFLSGILLCAGLVALTQEPAQSAIKLATIVEVLDGNQVFIQNKPAQAKDIAQKDQQVRTGDSRTQLVFDNGAIGRLGKNAQLIVGSQCFQVQKGQILINGAVDGCTKSRRLSVRGTTYTVEVNDQDQATVTVLEGEVTVSPMESSTGKNPSSPKPTSTNSPEVALAEGEQVAVAPEGTLGQVVKVPREEFERLLKGDLFNGFATQIPGISKVQESFQRLFPGVPFPIRLGIPGLPIPRPSLPF